MSTYIAPNTNQTNLMLRDKQGDGLYYFYGGIWLDLANPQLTAREEDMLATKGAFRLTRQNVEVLYPTWIFQR